MSKSKSDPVYFAKEFLGIYLHPGQVNYIKHRDKINVLSPANRFGKSTLVAVLHIWYQWTKKGVKQGDMKAWMNAEYLTCALAPHSQQADVVIRTIRQILTSSYSFVDPETGKLTSNQCKIEWFLTKCNETAPMSIEFAFGGKTLVRSTGEDRGKSIAAKSFAYIGYDEAGKCYSDDTEVLTTDGWKSFYDVNIGDKVPSLNLSGGYVENAKVDRVIIEPYSGDMVQFGGGRNQYTDLLVTPNHKMVVAKSKGANQYADFDFEEAGNLIGKHFKVNQSFISGGNIPDYYTIHEYQNKENGTGIRRFPEKTMPIRDFLLLLGLYISEGSCWKSRVTISQTDKGKAFKMLPELLYRLGLNWKPSAVGFNIFDKQFTEHIKSIVPCLCQNKRIPREILNLHPELLEYLLEGLILGDGAWKDVEKMTSGTYGTSSKGLADDVMELCLKLQMVPSLNITDKIDGGFIKGRKINGSRVFYRVNFRKSNLFPRMNHHPQIGSYSTVRIVPYTGNIVCLAIDKNHTLMVRRNGRIMWSGNSLHLEEEYKSTLLPRLADLDGDIDLIGTPDADSPSFVFFQEMFWRGGGDNYPKAELHYSQEGSAAQNPYLPKGYVAQMKLKYPPGDPYLEQVLHGKFISVGNKVFDHKAIIECTKEIPEYIPYESGHRYVIGVDTAIGNDDIVFTVLDWTIRPFKVVRISAKKGNSQSPLLHLQDLMDIFYHYNMNGQCTIILETFNGESMRFYYDLPSDMRYKTRPFGSGRIIGAPPKRAGQVDRKEDILIATRKLLDAHEVEFSENHRKLIQQLANYTQNDEKIRQDYVISFCLACFYATDGQPKNKVLNSTAMSW